MFGPSQRVIALLGNPASGRGRGRLAIEAALTLLRERGIDPATFLTERAGHAIELAGQAVEGGAELLLVVGGDGTVRDVAEGVGGRGAAIGILPGGTGNDLARTLGLPRELPQALEAALSGGERALDAWLWNGTPFVNVAGVGLDAAVAAAVNRRFRSLRGTLAYVAAFCTVMPGFKPFPMRLSWPGGGWEGETWVTAVANARCYGGGMQIAPDAAPDDGLLDVVVIEGVSRLQLLRQFPNLFSGAHVRHPCVQVLRVPSVTLEAPPQEATIDGELIGRTPARIEAAGWKLRVRVPASGA